MTCGFEDLFNVNKLRFSFTKKRIKEIQDAWEYLKNKPSQRVQIVVNPMELEFESDDELFNTQVYQLIISIEYDRTIYIECCDDCCSKCFSDFISEVEMSESNKIKNNNL